MLRLGWKDRLGPKDAFARSTPPDGRFTIAVEDDFVEGCLRARAYRDTLASIVLEGVRAGAGPVDLALRPSRETMLVVRDSDGEELDVDRVDHEYEMCGAWVSDSPGPRKERGEPFRWVPGLEPPTTDGVRGGVSDGGLRPVRRGELGRRLGGHVGAIADRSVDA